MVEETFGLDSKASKVGHEMLSYRKLVLVSMYQSKKEKKMFWNCVFGSSSKGLKNQTSMFLLFKMLIMLSIIIVKFSII